MIDKSELERVVNEWLEGTEYFLVDIQVSPTNEVQVVIDHAEGVWIEDCAQLSRHIKAHFDSEKEDYELEVGSAGLGQPFKVHRQWLMNVGQPVEVILKDGRKLQGTLLEVTDDAFAIEVEQKVKPEGAKRPRKEMVRMDFNIQDAVSARYLIKMK